MSDRVVLLQLNDNGEPVKNSSGVLTLPSLPLPEGYKSGDVLFTVRLLIAAASPISRDGLIWTNAPVDNKTPFDRNRFNKRLISHSFHEDTVIDIDIYNPGSFAYYVSFRNDNEDLETTRKFYFVVPPTLHVNGELVQLNSIALESIVSKWIGPIDKWDTFFGNVAKKGYNMIHFTPLQQRGESNSPYSLYDQLKFDPEFFKSEKEVQDMAEKLRKNHGVMSLTDVVYNHTANNSEWLREHPEAGYNAETAPHLIPAIELDGELLKFGCRLKVLGYPTDFKTTDDLLKVMDGIKIHVMGNLKLWEYYVVDVINTIEQLSKIDWSKVKPLEVDIPTDLVELAAWVRESDIICEIPGKRFLKLDLSSLASVIKKWLQNNLFDSAIEEEAQKLLDEINLPFYKSYDADHAEIMEQLFNRIKYLRIDENGPKMGPITMFSPLAEPYFTRFTGADGKEYQLANNGWIWNGNPLVDFASNESKAYLRREVIVWGDCVKLRYGKSPQDSPYLWKRMSEYTEMNAKIFDGFRIDNCHSTPLHVGEYFLDVARRVNPNLYVVAELFTGSEEMDCLFVERLGVSSLIREAMQAWSPEELSRLVHRHGGRPIGSYKTMPLDGIAYNIDSFTGIDEVPIPRFLKASSPHALFMDCTHDNETPYQKRTVEDTLPTAALVAFCSSATGSVYGFDEIYPYLLDVVNEHRTYDTDVEGKGIIEVKTNLNNIRNHIIDVDLEDAEMHVHHEGQYITFHRINATTGKGFFLIARTKFNNSEGDQYLSPVLLTGTSAEFEFGYYLEKTGEPEKNDKIITGVPTKLHQLTATVEKEGHDSKLCLPDYFPQGSIAVFRTQHVNVSESNEAFFKSGFHSALNGLNLYDLNCVLYRCESEERDASAGKEGTYNIPNYGYLKYAGLQGWITVLKDVAFRNDLAHPISEHLRNGHWALDYVVNRLEKYPKTAGVQQWLHERMEVVKTLPSYLVPRYFTLVIGTMYEAARCKALSLMPKNIRTSTLFVQRMALTSVQLIADLKSTSIVPEGNWASMAAGLPHFSHDYMRCWGRDVFIALRGLCLATGRYEDARQHILAFTKTLKHGLMPNLLDAGRNPRYNARDAVWFYMQSIQDYVEVVPGGESILKEKVTRRFPLDDTWVPVEDGFKYESSVEEVMYEVLARHAKGIKYREANAGRNLDRVMKDEGFNVEVFIDWETGLVHGGSQFNCGTWMDKMGESEKAGSCGVPGTPRDGANVELNGLLKSALRFVNGLKDFPSDHVEKPDGTKISLRDWEQLVQDNFEKKFYVPLDPADDHKFDINPEMVNRRGIYKDLYRSGKEYEDYQLRCNAMVALTVAPELFTPEYALEAIKNSDEIIRGPVGMRTLDPSDLNYRPYYDNAEDSDDFATSKGRNYHQGPEWIWPLGYFLRAYHHFHFKLNPKCKDNEKPSAFLYQELYKRLEGNRRWIEESPWAGLTELSNKDGAFCYDSSPTQAWSTGCLLDLFFDLWTSYEE